MSSLELTVSMVERVRLGSEGGLARLHVCQLYAFGEYPQDDDLTDHVRTLRTDLMGLGEGAGPLMLEMLVCCQKHLDVLVRHVAHLRLTQQALQSIEPLPKVFASSDRY